MPSCAGPPGTGSGHPDKLGGLHVAADPDPLRWAEPSEPLAWTRRGLLPHDHHRFRDLADISGGIYPRRFPGLHRRVPFEGRENLPSGIPACTVPTEWQRSGTRRQRLARVTSWLGAVQVLGRHLAIGNARVAGVFHHAHQRSAPGLRLRCDGNHRQQAPPPPPTRWRSPPAGSTGGGCACRPSKARTRGSRSDASAMAGASSQRPSPGGPARAPGPSGWPA